MLLDAIAVTGYALKVVLVDHLAIECILSVISGRRQQLRVAICLFELRAIIHDDRLQIF